MSDRSLDPGQPASPGAVETLLPFSGPVRRVLQATSVGLVVFAAAWSSLALIQHTGRVAPVWPANAFVLVCLLRTDARRWPGFILAGLTGNLAADLITGDKVYVALGLSLANALEIAIGAYGMRRFVGRDIDLTRRRDLLVFGALAGAVAPLVSACFAMSWLRSPINQNFWPNFGTWVLADALGAVILVPALLALTPATIKCLWAPQSIRRNLLFFALLVAVMTAVFAQSRYPLGILMVPTLLLITFELGFIGASLGILVTAIISLGFTLTGHGPATLVAASSSKQVLALQTFLAVATFSILPVASALARARRLQASLATSLDAAETARAESVEAQRWARMAEQTANVGYWRLPTRGKASWSPEVYRIHGFDPDGPADPHAAIKAVHPDDLDWVLEGLKAARAEGRSFEGVYRIGRTDGSWRTVSCRTISEKDSEGSVVAVVGTVLDITEFKQIEAAALESEARYRLLADKASDVISRTDLAGHHIYLSPASQQVLGYAPEELIGRLTLDFVHPDDREAFLQPRERLALKLPEPTSPPVVYRFRHRSGEWIWLESHPTLVLDDQGRPSEFVSVTRDITRAKAAEAELMAAREAAEAATLAKGEFLANMSHEIRTPLTSIMGFSSLLNETGEMPENARHYVQRISTAGQSLLSVVNDILDFSKLEAGQVELDPQPFDPAGFIHETSQLLAVQAANKGLDWRTEVEGALPELIVADSARLRQVLLNLLGNAIKFTAKGGVVVRISHQSEGSGRLDISIADTGPGIPAERRDRLFQRFSQIDGSVSRIHGGTGLGLAICKSLVELMGGEIGVASTEGGGSTFWFSIAAPPAEAVPVEPADESAALLDQGEAWRPAHILIVDDLAVNRELVRAMLTPFGHDFEEAENGAEAVRAALRSRYDLILMDLQMPGMDGFEAARTIRATCDLNRATPIIALSANVLPAHIVASQAAGMDDHLGKPIVPTALVAKVAMWAGATHEQPPIQANGS